MRTRRRCSYVVITVSTTLAMMPSLQVLVSQLPDAWHPVITARDHQAVASLVPSASIVNRRSLSETIRALQHVDALVLGGGSLLQDGTSFKSLLYYLILLWSPGSIASRSFFGDKDWVLSTPVEPMVCAGNVGQNPGGLLERPRLVASSPTMAIGHADGDGAGSGLVPSGTCLVGWSGPDSLPPTDTAAEHEGLADVVAGPGSLQRPITFEGHLACLSW